MMLQKRLRQSFGDSPAVVLLVLGLAAVLIAMLAGVLAQSPKLGVVFAGAFVGGLLVLRWPGIGVGVLTFLLPLERMQRFTNDETSFTISIMRFVALAALGALILHRLVKRQKIALDPSMLIYGGYVLIAVLSAFYSTDFPGAKRAIGTIGANVLFFFLYLNYFKNRRQVYAMLFIWLASNVLAMGYSAYDWNLGSGRSGGIETDFDPGEGAQITENRWSTVWQDRAEYETLGSVAQRRSMGPTSHAAVYGINMVMTIPFFILLLNYCDKRVWKFAALFAILGLLAYNLMLTNTRAVLLQAGITGGICLVMGLYRLRTYHILLAIVGCAAMSYVVPKDVFTRVLDPANYSLEKSAAMRVRISYWKAGFEILETRWLTGMGVGNEVEIPKYVVGESAEKSTVHNTYLQFLLEVGIIGWCCFYGFVLTVFYYAYRASRFFKDKPGWEMDSKLLVGVMVAMLSVLIFGVQVDVFLFPLKGWWLLALITIVYFRWFKEFEKEGGDLL